MDLVRPAAQHLPTYAEALRRAWSPSTERDMSPEILVELEQDPEGYLASLDDRHPVGRTVTLRDGTVAPRLPGLSRWMWDGEFAGAINLRWQEGTADLPPYCLGHIGYSVVPWRRRLGYATEALRQLLPIAREVGLPFVDLTTDPDNLGSRKVIETNGGVLVERFTKHVTAGGGMALRYRVALD